MEDGIENGAGSAHANASIDDLGRSTLQHDS